MADRNYNPRKDEITVHTYFKIWTLLGPIIGAVIGIVLGLLMNNILEGVLLGAGLGLFFGSSYGLRKDSKVHHDQHLGD